MQLKKVALGGATAVGALVPSLISATPANAYVSGTKWCMEYWTADGVPSQGPIAKAYSSSHCTSDYAYGVRMVWKDSGVPRDSGWQKGDGYAEVVGPVAEARVGAVCWWSEEDGMVGWHYQRGITEGYCPIPG